jgi:hypothetical protein
VETHALFFIRLLLVLLILREEEQRKHAQQAADGDADYFALQQTQCELINLYTCSCTLYTATTSTRDQLLNVKVKC